MFYSWLSSPAVFWSRLRGTVSPKTIVIIAGALVALGIGYWILSPSTEDLLDIDGNLTPKQIRAVATKLLLHDDVKIRSRASAKLVSVGELAAPVLKDIGLTSSDANLRIAIYGVLTSIDNNAAVEVVQSMYNNTDIRMREFAVENVSQLDDPRVVAILIKALDDPEYHIRSTAAGRLGGTGDKSAVPKLKQALNDPDTKVRRHAARSLRDLTGVDYSDRIK